MNQARLIILEGNISAGKTSLSRDLGKLLDYQVFLEPTITNPYLASYYAEPKKYALVMQLWLLKQRFRTYIAAIKHSLHSGKGVLLDRSVFSDWVFAEKNRVDGNISYEGFREYSEMRDKLLFHLPVPQITLFLDVSPQECYRRVHSLRCRDVEVGIPLNYLSGLDECYRKFLGLMEKQGSRVLKIDWNSFGNSNSVAQLLKQSFQAVPPLSDVVDVHTLTDYVYNNPFVRSIVEEDSTLMNEELQEEAYADAETKNKEPVASPRATQPVLPPSPISIQN